MDRIKTAYPTTEADQGSPRLRCRYEDLLNNVPLGIARSNRLRRRFFEVNPAMERITGYSKQELLGLDISQLYFDPEEREAILKEALSRGAVLSREMRFRRKDGSEVVVLLSEIKVKDNSGNSGLLDLVEDVTERKQTELALAQAEEKFLKAFRCVPDPISIATLKSGILIEVNDAFESLIGYSREETVGKRAWDINFWDSPSRSSLIEVLEEQGALRDIEIQFRTKSGDIRSGLFSADRIDVGIGEPCWICTVRDITRRKLAEDALRKSERFSRKLLESSPNPIVAIELDTSIGYVNPALRKLTGFKSRDVIGGKAPYPWWCPQTRHQTGANLLDTLGKMAGKYEDVFRKNNGEVFWVEVSFVAIADQEHKYYLENWVDVTDKKQLRENMKSYIVEVTKAQEEERKRIARELHDGPAQMLAALLMDIYAVLSDCELGDLNRQRLEALITSLNGAHDEIYRISQELRPGLLEKLGLVSSLGMLTRALQKRCGLRCRIETKGTHVRLLPEADVLLFRVAQEAINNIARHSKATEVLVSIQYGTGTVRLVISDNGVGFEVPPNIGDFARGGKLGLIGMLERVQLLGGHLAIKSLLGKGTVVTAEIPSAMSVHGHLYK